jgi:hypothetical protein
MPISLQRIFVLPVQALSPPAMPAVTEAADA